MSTERSPDTTVSEEPASWADGTAGDGRDLPQSRGFLGRILDAFGSGDSDPDNGGAVVAGRELSALGAPGIVNLRRLRVDDVAVPKAEIMAVPVDIDLPDLVQMFREQGFSRFPVYRGTLDSPLGLVHLKDLALKYGFDATPPTDFALRPLLRPLLYVPLSMPIGVLLLQMQQKRIHMALVIDEYGGVDGLVTIEDLVEQVLGEIDDEHDEVEGELWLVEKPDQWLIQARMPLAEVETLIGRPLGADRDDEDVDTLGGLIFMHTGRVPVQGEVIRLDGGTEIEIVDADPRRVKRVRLRVLPPEAEATGE